MTNKWISVSERLPENRHPVLVCYRQRYRLVVYPVRIVAELRDSSWLTVPGSLTVEPTHWMPLPSPPRVANQGTPHV